VRRTRVSAVMTYLIDGYNLIKSSFFGKEEARGIEQAISFLIRKLSEFRRKHRTAQFVVVLDGHPPPGFPIISPAVKTIFSGAITADEKIRLILEKDSQKASVTVVSNDRQVQASAVILGARPMSVQDFVTLLVPLPKPVRKVADKLVDSRTALEIEKELKAHYEEKESQRGIEKSRP